MLFFNEKTKRNNALYILKSKKNPKKNHKNPCRILLNPCTYPAKIIINLIKSASKKIWLVFVWRVETAPAEPHSKNHTQSYKICIEKKIIG